MQAVLVSAITAAVVTLLVEYAAKPRLEARKDRIVGRVRLQRELEAQISTAIHHRAYVPERKSPVDEDIVADLITDLSTCIHTTESLLAHGFDRTRAQVIIDALTVSREQVLRTKRPNATDELAEIFGLESNDELAARDASFVAGFTNTRLRVALKILRMGWRTRIAWRIDTIRTARREKRQLRRRATTIAPPSDPTERAFEPTPSSG
jgi:hypothetical protein